MLFLGQWLDFEIWALYHFNEGLCGTDTRSLTLNIGLLCRLLLGIDAELSRDLILTKDTLFMLHLDLLKLLDWADRSTACKFW